MSKELKPCVNDKCPDYDNETHLNCREWWHGWHGVNKCFGYLTEKPESAWDMARRLKKENGHNDRIYNQIRAVEMSEYNEQQAIEIMKEIEEKLNEKD